MTTEQYDSPYARVVALDYYDGAIEGFVRNLDNYGSCYFKLVAWDESQFKRLFAVTPIAKDVFNKICGLLPKEEAISVKMWLPDWSRVNSDDKVVVDDIIYSCRQEIVFKGILVLADKIDSSSIETFEMIEGTEISMKQLESNPENLNDWLFRLGWNR